MIELIIFIVLVVSLVGALIILLRKLSALLLLPQNGSHDVPHDHIIVKTKNKVKEFFIYIEKQIFLHKLLSWLKVIILKVERRIDNLLHGIRKKAQQVDKK